MQCKIDDLMLGVLETGKIRPLKKERDFWSAF